MLNPLGGKNNTEGQSFTGHCSLHLPRLLIIVEIKVARLVFMLTIKRCQIGILTQACVFEMGRV